MKLKRAWYAVALSTAISVSLTACGAETQQISSWNTDLAVSALENCQIDYSTGAAVDGPVSAGNLLEQNALVTGNGWLVLDLASSWDKSGISPIESNCLFSELGLSANLISVISDDVKQQKANFQISEKSSSEYRKTLDSLEKDLLDAKAAPEWNKRLAAYYAELKAWACSVDDDCEQYWMYTVAGDFKCKVQEFCDEDYFPRSPRPAGAKLEKKLETKIETATNSLELVEQFEEDSIALFKSIGEQGLEMAFVFDASRKLIAVIGAN